MAQLIRRRGVGRRIIPAQRRHHLDHRQGRHHPGAAGLGDPGRHRHIALAAVRRTGAEYGAPTYARIDAPANRGRRPGWPLSPDQVSATELAGEPITAKADHRAGQRRPARRLKVTTENAWFAARPSGTEDVYKIYAESFKGPEHLAQVQDAAREVVNTVIA